MRFQTLKLLSRLINAWDFGHFVPTNPETSPQRRARHHGKTTSDHQQPGASRYYPVSEVNYPREVDVTAVVERRLTEDGAA